ncbi:hypothetical protein [Pontiella agarivorans]|uniref:Uncharacterized protein n=1 Tax=Pontiella agarivorans TaxID=3038953 RepID=A0ABU5MS97_9BACT|nr:hypothetical protein [Pontiella agarivorans]MDZ8117072.1 hypothetical protein [Pontiella agarivorans]
MKRKWIILGAAGVLFAAATATAGTAKHAARVMVKGELEKERESSKDERENSSTRIKSESQHYELQVTVSNVIKKDGTFDLEWYFFKRNLDSEGEKSEPVLCEKDKVTLSIAGMKRVQHSVHSAELIWKETKTSKSSSNNNSSGSSGGKTFSGSMYDGYVILVRNEGQIVAKYSDERKYLTPTWMGRLDMPVEAGSARSSAPKKKKKKK